MKYLNDRYIGVVNYKGFDICTLKEANPTNGDKMGYVIDDPAFANMVFEHPEAAMKKIDTVN